MLHLPALRLTKEIERKILISESVCRAVEKAVPCEPLGFFKVKGKKEKVRVFAINTDNDPYRNFGVYESPQLFLKKIAKTTGGRAFSPTKRDERLEIASQILPALRSQYSFEYVSAKPQGKNSTLEVTVKVDVFGVATGGPGVFEFA